MADTEDSREKKRAYHREYFRKWTAINREKRNEYIRKRRAANSERINALRREWNAKNRAANPMASAYRTQKNSAKRRGIPWLFTFDEWCKVWLESGKWEQRGYLPDQYVMARYGDIGPYAVGNVRVCTARENNRESADKRIGQRRSPETVAKVWETRRLRAHR